MSGRDAPHARSPKRSKHGSDTEAARVAPALKRFGQHFLTDQRVVERILTALNPQPAETIIEIGPGRGALTEKLVEKAGKVLAVEIDRKLVPALEERFGHQPNFQLIQQDALVTDFCQEIHPATNARLVANLPYNISTAILQRLIGQRACLTELVLMLQREVVDRITAVPGSSDRGYLSVLVEAYSQTEKLFDVAPSAFRPPPKVWSSVIRVNFRQGGLSSCENEGLFWQLVSAGFSQRRKTILNNLRVASGDLMSQIKKHGGASIVLCRAAVDVSRRAETLTLEEWMRVARALG